MITLEEMRKQAEELLIKKAYCYEGERGAFCALCSINAMNHDKMLYEQRRCPVDGESSKEEIEREKSWLKKWAKTQAEFYGGVCYFVTYNLSERTSDVIKFYESYFNEADFADANGFEGMRYGNARHEYGEKKRDTYYYETNCD